MTLIIFDFDGVILDSPRESKRRLSIILKRNRIFSQKVFDLWGRPVVEMLVNGLDIPETRAKEIEKQWEEFKDGNPVNLILGVKEALEYCSSRGFKTILFSSRSTENLSLMIEQYNLKSIFSLVVGLEGDIDGKLEKGLYRKDNIGSFGKILEHFSREGAVENIVYIGDTVFDVTCAVKIPRVNAVAVLSGDTSFKEFVDSGVLPENIIPSVKEFQDWLELYI